MRLSGNFRHIDIHYHVTEQNAEQNTEAVFRVTNHLVSASRRIYPEECETHFSAGIHPKDFEQADFLQLKKLLTLPGCHAVGECGLDRLVSKDLKQQTNIFLHQAELAEEFEKPLIIHCVRAFPELIRLKNQINPRQPWILHGYRGNERKTLELAEAGFMFSFGRGILLSSAEMQPFFHRIPPDRIFCETDESGEDIRRIYAETALLCQMPEPEFCRLVRNNCERVF